VQVVLIADRMFVDDHDISHQALEAPVLLSLQHLTHECHARGADHADEQDGVVSRNRVWPEPGLPQRVCADHVRIGPHGSVGAKHARHQSLKEQRLVTGNSQVPEGAFRACSGQRERPGGGGEVVILAGQCLDRRPVGCHARGVTQTRRAAGWQPDALAQADNRIQHNARGARQRASVERLRIVRRAAAAQEPCAIGFPLQRPLRTAFETQGVKRPGLGVARITAAPVAHERAAVRVVLGLDEEFAKGRVRMVVLRGGQHDLRITGDVDLPHAIAVVTHGEAPHFHVVFGRDRDLQMCRQSVVAPADADTVGRKRDGVVLWCDASGLIGS